MHASASPTEGCSDACRASPVRRPAENGAGRHPIGHRPVSLLVPGGQRIARSCPSPLVRRVGAEDAWIIPLRTASRAAGARHRSSAAGRSPSLSRRSRRLRRPRRAPWFVAMPLRVHMRNRGTERSTERVGGATRGIQSGPPEGCTKARCQALNYAWRRMRSLFKRLVALHGFSTAIGASGALTTKHSERPRETGASGAPGGARVSPCARRRGVSLFEWWRSRRIRHHHLRVCPAARIRVRTPVLTRASRLGSWWPVQQALPRRTVAAVG